MKVIVSNIQRFCLHDGPGIRTTIFFKGCNLRCPWCSNPENIEMNIQEYKENEEVKHYGYEMSLKEIEEIVLKDQLYYENGGGVTFSGGDGLLQFKKIEPLLKSLKEKNINLCVETSLVVPEEMVKIATRYIDTFLVDIKVLIEKDAYKIRTNPNLFKRNVEQLFQRKCDVVFRIPLVPEYTTTKENLEEILKFLHQYPPKRVEIFPIHRLGEKKYKSLHQTMPLFKEISEKEIDEIKSRIEKLGIEVLAYQF